MSIKRTRKYIAAVDAARRILGGVPAHATADALYIALEVKAYWDVDEGWIENPQIDPLREMDKQLIRVRVTAHMSALEDEGRRIVALLAGGEDAAYDFSEMSKPYPNVRDADGAGRLYITFRLAGRP